MVLYFRKKLGRAESWLSVSKCQETPKVRGHIPKRPYEQKEGSLCGATISPIANNHLNEQNPPRFERSESSACGKDLVLSYHLQTVGAQRGQNPYNYQEYAKKPYEHKQNGKTFVVNKTGGCINVSQYGVFPFKCKICREAFCNLFLLCMNTHTGEKPYECPHSWEGFRSLRNVLFCERFHTGKKDYDCKICGKVLNYFSCLRKCESIHTGLKPYVCKVCGKAFSRSHHVQRHERTHTGEKPYVCKLCGKAFSRPCHVQRHEKIHTSKKPYECKVSGETFTHYSSFKNHERIHTEEKLWMQAMWKNL